jgi:hypothetical protein
VLGDVHAASPGPDTTDEGEGRPCREWYDTALPHLPCPGMMLSGDVVEIKMPW